MTDATNGPAPGAGIPWSWSDARAILERTPGTLRVWLHGLPEPWIRNDEGGESWSPYEVVGHLVHGERTDWVPRARHILEGRGDEPFEPFDRFAMQHEDPTTPLGSLLDSFTRLRMQNLAAVDGFHLGDEELDLPGTHPELGPVTLRQLLATWAAHDLTHLGQIARVMAKQWRDEVGPWRAYLPLLDR